MKSGISFTKLRQALKKRPLKKTSEFAHYSLYKALLYYWIIEFLVKNTSFFVILTSLDTRFEKNVSLRTYNQQKSVSYWKKGHKFVVCLQN